ncbi:hypothetical protein Mnod_0743 [Methylobacterium nodulans ORS 2060]|uniref:Uncharacterized protein n=1 Tax=Methylobacterium nodulans (strain LMG 21967 / CNCM I-2342 / ORS 2060) TaxID=460265 RepID=B8IF64_METNO|nr:hypothetical protein Mnod_0743 [Methylobacterium nodulans ORS 2060]
MQAAQEHEQVARQGGLVGGERIDPGGTGAPAGPGGGGLHGIPSRPKGLTNSNAHRDVLLGPASAAGAAVNAVPRLRFRVLLPQGRDEGVTALAGPARRC